MILTIDPGINAMGVACWDKQYFGTIPKLPMWAASFELTKDVKEGEPWDQRIEYLVDTLRKHLKQIGWATTGIWCEMPVLFAGAGGHAAARRGDLTHLAFAVGRLCGFAAELKADYFKTVEVQEWIGQLPKDLTHKRVRDCLNVIDTDSARVDYILGKKASHHWDAIGLGLYAQGMWR